MKTFKDLEFTLHPDPIIIGQQAKLHFDNDYGVSVVRIEGTPGYRQGLWQVGILYKGGLTKDTPITDKGDDVVNGLTDDGVTEVMKKVQAL